ncbi:hypothetical protein F4825DRAFT_432936 [Nemania diffusa]|nr:hypothetical protein F4825DRAFT_432936 [Nemania diffusa]
MRVRERNAKLSPYQLAVERAKSNDLKAVSTAWRDRGETEAFQRASPAEKERIIAETEEEVMVRRRRKGIDADTKILALNLQFSEDERSPGLSSGGLAGTGAGKGKSVPAMAPPGYQPFPTQPLPHLMGRGKKPAFPGAGPATSAGRASLSEDDAAGPVLERQDYPMMDRANAEFSAAIEDFKNLQAEGDRRSAEERLYIMTQLRLLRGDVTTLGQQLEQLMALLQQPAGRQEAAPLQQQHVSAQQQQQHASAQQHGPAQQQHASSVYGNHPSGPHTYPLPPIQGSSAHQSTHQPWRCYTTALSKFADNKFADDGDHY